MDKALALALMTLTSLVAPQPAAIAAAAPSNEAAGQADLVSEVVAIAADRPFTLALRLTLPEGWHTYWRNPGDAGAPIAVTWRLPEGFSAGDLRWPAPERFVSGPIVSFGYQDEAWLLTTMTPAPELALGQRVTIAATAEWLICAKICVPQHADLSLALPVAAAPQPAPAATQAALALARAALPERPPWPVTATAGAESIELRLDLPPQPVPRISEAAFFPAGHDMINIAAEQHLAWRDGTTLLRLPKLAGQPPPETLTGVLVLTDGRHRRGYELNLDVAR
jgi:thiol:disulfide interchange protein DsbD